MIGIRLGQAARKVRRRMGLRQLDVARRAGCSQSTISRLETGHIDTLTLRELERICGVLAVRVDIVPRWRGADLDRLLNAQHSALHEAIAKLFAQRWPGWTLAPEVTFAIYGERGVIDILAWHPRHRALLVIELKTAIVDVNELIGSADRKRRLAATVARERGWDPRVIGSWVIVAQSRTNRRHLDQHAAVLGNAYPAGRADIRAWLQEPDKPIAALTLENAKRAGGGVPARRA